MTLLPYEFKNQGRDIILRDSHAIRNADGDLWNDRMQLKINHRGEVDGRVMTPNPQSYAESGRWIYLQSLDDDKPHTLPWGPSYEDDPDFSFRLGQEDVEWNRRLDDLTVRLGLTLPRNEAIECWQLELLNDAPTTQHWNLTIAVPTGILGLLSHENSIVQKPFGIVHSYFPYYVKIEDYEKMAQRWNETFCFADKDPNSWTALEESFLGLKGWANPRALSQPNLPGDTVHYQRGLIGLQYKIELKAKESWSLNWILGPARNPEHRKQILDNYHPTEAFDKALDEQKSFFKAQQKPFSLKVNDPDFEAFANFWSPHRSVQIGRTLRFNPSPQARNAIQDSMTLTWFDPQKAAENFLKIWAHQESSGFMPHGLPMEPNAEIMPITLIPHKDTNVWGPIALDVYLRETGDFEILNRSIPYSDRGDATLQEHIEKGLQWLLEDRTERGLSRIGQGDWNDPLNMVGPQGKGESVWLSEALAYACDLWAKILQAAGKSTGNWKEQAAECRQAVRAHAWDGAWYARAFTDDGEVIGSFKNKEGQIFLNAQSWALIAGVPDQKQARSILQSVENHLMTPVGPAVVAPAYTGMDKNVGKLTLKSPGTGENGSIYCHACLFYVHALYKTGETEKAWSIFRNLLSGTEQNPLSQSGQWPVYIPNFFRGPASPAVFGQSSHAPTTGSAAWYYKILLEDILGLKASFDHLQICPRLPKAWNGCSATRHFRGATYEISYIRKEGLGDTIVRMGGKDMADGILPIPTSGQTYQVQVFYQ